MRSVLSPSTGWSDRWICNSPEEFIPLVLCRLTHQRNSLHSNQPVNYSRICPLLNRCTATGKRSTNVETCATMRTRVCYRIEMLGEQDETCCSIGQFENRKKHQHWRAW